MTLIYIANQLQGGGFTLSEWQSEMREYLRSEYESAVILSAGGVRSDVTQSDWGYMGSLLKKQYQYLDSFASDIANNPAAWLNGNALFNRMQLYSDSAYTALENMLARKMAQNGFTEEKNMLGTADHCNGCLAQTAKGWSPIGSLVPIGQRDCIVKCKCAMKYRKPTGNGGYAYA